MRAILSSGVASARKSSTPASLAMAAAVSGLSPVIITVRMPMRRSSAKRSAMPSLTTSLRWITPRTRLAVGDGERRAAALRDAVSTIGSSSAGTVPPCSSTQRRTESVAPLRIDRPSMSTPLMRVCAVKGTSVAPESSRSRRP